MDVQPARVGAAGHLAATLITQQHGAAQRGGNGLLGTPEYPRASLGTAGPGRLARAHVGVVSTRSRSVGSVFVLVTAVVGLQVVSGRRAPVCDMPDVLRVTAGHPDDVGADRHEP